MMVMPVVFTAIAPVGVYTGIDPLSAVMVATGSLRGELGLVLNHGTVVAVAMSVTSLHILLRDGLLVDSVEVVFMELGCVGIPIVELVVNRPRRQRMNLLRVNDLGNRLAGMLLGVFGILLKVWVHSLCMDRQGHADETCRER